QLPVCRVWIQCDLLQDLTAFSFLPEQTSQDTSSGPAEQRSAAAAWSPVFFRSSTNFASMIFSSGQVFACTSLCSEDSCRLLCSSLHPSGF
uniref:Uncharacterized protein n=1 Tax=Salarias fasciatus TaxID=181472 RepID=A0A672G1Q2_SALFA